MQEEKHAAWALYKLSEDEIKSLHKKYCPSSAPHLQPDTAPKSVQQVKTPSQPKPHTSTQPEPHTQPQKKTQTQPHTAPQTIPHSEQNTKPTKKNYKKPILITTVLLLGTAIFFIAAFVIKNSKTSPVSTENSSQNSYVDVTANYSFDNGTQTLTVFSDDYFRDDYKQFNGFPNNPSAKVKHAVISKGVTIITQNAFCYCENLESITLSDSITEISGSAFSNCKSLKRIIIPNSITSIGEYAFFLCSSLTSVIIPESVTSIGYCAFEGCTNLKNITIPYSVTKMGYNVFDGWTAEQTIYIQGRSTAAMNYHAQWKENCTAKIVWNA